jgi:membrane protein
VTPSRPELVIRQAVIFDVDGTLVDTLDAHLESWHEVLNRFGYHPQLSELEALFGKHSQEWVRTLVPPEDQDDLGERIIQAKDRAFFRHLNELPVFPGAAELIRDLCAAGKRIAIASSATAAELPHYLRKLEIADLVHATVDGDEVTNGKPDPEGIRLVLDKLDLPAGKAVLVGDSLSDGEAARAAGVAFVGVLTGGFAEGTLREAGACEVYEDVGALYETVVPLLNAERS